MDFVAARTGVAPRQGEGLSPCHDPHWLDDRHPGESYEEDAGIRSDRTGPDSQRVRDGTGKQRNKPACPSCTWLFQSRAVHSASSLKCKWRPARSPMRDNRGERGFQTSAVTYCFPVDQGDSNPRFYLRQFRLTSLTWIRQGRHQPRRRTGSNHPRCQGEDGARAG
jgi:hypothetical protein